MKSYSKTLQSESSNSEIFSVLKESKRLNENIPDVIHLIYIRNPFSEITLGASKIKILLIILFLIKLLVLKLVKPHSSIDP